MLLGGQQDVPRAHHKPTLVLGAWCCLCAMLSLQQALSITTQLHSPFLLQPLSHSASPPGHSEAVFLLPDGPWPCREGTTAPPSPVAAPVPSALWVSIAK